MPSPNTAAAQRSDLTLPTLNPHPGDRPTHPPLALDLAARTDVGKVRERNEDQFVIARLGRWLAVTETSIGVPRELTSPQGTLLVVADGMGGEGGGDVASAVTLDSFVEHSLLEMPWLATGSAEGDALLAVDVERFVVASQEKLRAVADRKHLPRRLGTTLTAAYVQGSRLMVVHVGDSRAYLCRAGALERLTNDHTWGAAIGEPSGAGKERGNLSHMLVNVIGASADRPRPELASLTLAAGDRVLLCSDGLHGSVDDARIGAIVSGAATARAAVDGLVEETLARGAPDNVTVVVAFG